MTLAAQDVCWSVGSVRIVEDVTLTAPVGASVGLLGPNGSGKSSLLRMLAAIRRPTSGTVTVEGDDAARLPRRRLAQRVALVEQEVNTDQDPRVADVIDLGRVPHRRPWDGATTADRDAVTRAARATNVATHLDRRYSTLSGGERQRVQLARALAQEPSVLLLDEPTNHLDVRHQIELLRLVRQAPVTVLMALHDLNLAAAFCDELVVLGHGRVVATGPPAEVLTPELIEEVYGVRARVVRDEDGLHVRFLTS
ncbi:ABC transporter ATP-binding protein [Nocardioides alcanivorans]|uniref:ABC transporter ATP-binding protein n=1 Tax=Nocardioides alcanivorans TaxID=2897352 RepID=UPI001F26EA05|nr:ABC transporter ATP-binding protein [Nocardioides alcanivorans]